MYEPRRDSMTPRPLTSKSVNLVDARQKANKILNDKNDTSCGCAPQAAPGGGVGTAGVFFFSLDKGGEKI